MSHCVSLNFTVMFTIVHQVEGWVNYENIGRINHITLNALERFRTKNFILKAEHCQRGHQFSFRDKLFIQVQSMLTYRETFYTAKIPALTCVRIWNRYTPTQNNKVQQQVTQQYAMLDGDKLSFPVNLHFPGWHV